MAEANDQGLGVGWWLLMHVGRWLIALMFRLNLLVVRGEAHFTRAVAGSRPVYVGLWHGRLIYSAWYLRRMHPTTLVSQSKDGELIARLLRAWGFTTIRGSSRKGSREALREMMQALEVPGALLAVTMDGPVGPVREAKPGSVALAARQGAVLLPMAGAASRHWTFKKSWDQFQLPKPFGRIFIQFGPPVEITPDMDENALARRMGERVTKLEQQADALAADLG